MIYNQMVTWTAFAILAMFLLVHVQDPGGYFDGNEHVKQNIPFPVVRPTAGKSVSRGNRTQICVLELVIGGRVRRAGRGGARGWVAVQRRVGPRLPKGTPPPK